MLERNERIIILDIFLYRYKYVFDKNISESTLFHICLLEI